MTNRTSLLVLRAMQAPSADPRRRDDDWVETKKQLIQISLYLLLDLVLEAMLSQARVRTSRGLLLRPSVAR